MNRGREFLVGLVIIVAVTVGVVGTLWLKGTNWGRLATPVEVLVSDVELRCSIPSPETQGR